MKQNLIQTLLFGILLFVMKLLFAKGDDLQTTIIYTVIGTIIYFAYRTFIRPMFLKKEKDQD